MHTKHLSITALALMAALIGNNALACTTTTPAMSAQLTCATPGSYDVTVPANATRMTAVSVIGGGGGGGRGDGNGGVNPGSGASLSGNVALPIGTVKVRVVVGSGGVADTNPGYPTTAYASGGGGGGSGFFALDASNAVLADLMIAGAGGGAGLSQAYGYAAGSGGSAAANGGASANYGGAIGGGGTAASGATGGAGGTGGTAGGPGASYSAGTVASATNRLALPPYNYLTGGGGGGGYAAGGAGGASWNGNAFGGGGGGGSSYTNSSYVSNLTSAIVSSAGPGYRGTSAGSAYGVPAAGNDGQVVLTFAPVATPPTVTAINPTSGSTAGGTPVTITGTNFTGATVVNVGGVACTPYNVASATSITCTTGAHAAGTASVEVTTPDGTNATNTLYTYAVPVPAPTVTAINPGTGVTTGGTAVTITGTNFTGASSVNVGGVACTPYTVVSATSITCTTGAHAAGSASVEVTTPGGTNASNALYTYAVNANGACGGAQGQAVSIAPSTNLCSTGSAGTVLAANGGYSWSCSALGSGTPASCTAPGATAPGSTTTTTTELVSGTGCRFSTVTPLAPPNGGPGGGVTMPYGVVDFTLLDCSAGQATVRMTYSGPVGGMTLWKYGPYPTPTSPVSWYQLTGATVSGNTITFTIQDNGPGDADPAVGVIADPAGPGNAPNSAQSIPTLSEWALIFMAGLLGLFGMAQVRRRR